MITSLQSVSHLPFETLQFKIASVVKESTDFLTLDNFFIHLKLFFKMCAQEAEVSLVTF